MKVERLTCDTLAWVALQEALTGAGLPTADLRDCGAYFAVHLPGRAPAFAGLEGSGPDILLRSVVIGPESRGRGFGALVVAAIENHAREQGATRLWLLTETAADFFARLGWREAMRTEAPPSIAATAQFREICPGSATLMCKRLAG